jgi:hypothetical protein
VSELVRSLADIRPGQAYAAGYAALLRMHLYLIGETHQRLLDFGAQARGILLGAAGEDGTLDGMGLFQAIQELEAAWRETFDDWERLFQALRWEAGGLAFGVLAVLHRAYIEEAGEGQPQGLPLQEAVEADIDGGVFKPQHQGLMNAAEQHIYSDGLNLSQRVWQLDNESLEGIKRILYNGVANGDSAWNMAKELEQYLGAGQDCPRWTRTRLYGLTKKEIAAGNRTGLYSREACAGQGVAYKALRMARNEIQIMHGMTTDALLAMQPWVEQEKISLSPSHPPIGCECEDVVKGGEDGDGVYPKGTITIPIHPQCLCLKTGVLMPEEQFGRLLGGWVRGEPWAAMDEYAGMLGVSPLDVFAVSLAVGMANGLISWLWGSEEDVAEQVQDALQWALPGEEDVMMGVYV